MYKNFSIEEIKNVKNNFLPHLYTIIKREKCQWINDLVKIIFKEWNKLYFFDRWDPFFKIAKKWENLELSDEIDKIQLTIPMNDKSKLQDLLKHYIMKKERQTWQKTIEEILFDEFKTGSFNTINWKPYLVYDIETTVWVWENLDTFKFLLAYSMTPWDQKMDYEYIDIEWLQNFAKQLVEFEWYVIWFNSFAFDNPITIKQGWLSNEDLETLNKKSLDIFYFIWNISGRRIWLNKLSEALIWIQKTLTSWAEWEVLRQEYQKTWDTKYLEEFKKYCKNDVRMTAFVLLYLLHFKKIFIDDKEITFTLEDFVKLAKPKSEIRNEEEKAFTNQSIFW